jgi:hypothetical protein
MVSLFNSNLSHIFLYPQFASLYASSFVLCALKFLLWVEFLPQPIISMNSSFNDSVLSLNKRAVRNIVTEKEAVTFAEQQLGMKKDDFPTKEIYVELPSGVLAHTYQFQLKSNIGWVQVSVDSGNLQIVQFIGY